MKQSNIIRAGVCLALALSAAPSRADFHSASVHYEKQEYEAARADYLQLAELGDAASDFNMGVMVSKGQGGPADPGAAVGWMQAAFENGYGGLTSEKISAMRARLNAAQQKSADAVAFLYGHEGLLAHTLPRSRVSQICGGVDSASVISVVNEYPLDPRPNNQDGMVRIEFQVGSDGLVHDPQVLMTVPPGKFEEAAVRSAMHVRYAPATINGHAAPSVSQFTFTYGGEQGALWNPRALPLLRKAADSGDTYSLYMLGMGGMLDTTLQIPEDKAFDMILSSAQGGYTHAQTWIAHRVGQLSACGEGEKWRVWMEHAARGGEGSAQINLAEYRLAKAGVEPLDASAMGEIKQLVESAAASSDPYAVKHAVAVLAASATPELHNPSLALKAAKPLGSGWLHSDPQTWEVMAAAAAANGDFGTATSQQRKAIDIAQALLWNVSAMQVRLASYQNKHAWTGNLLELPPRTDALPPPPSQHGHICRSKDDHSCDRRDADELRAATGSHIAR